MNEFRMLMVWLIFWILINKPTYCMTTIPEGQEVWLARGPETETTTLFTLPEISHQSTDAFLKGLAGQHVSLDDLTGQQISVMEDMDPVTLVHDADQRPQETFNILGTKKRNRGRRRHHNRHINQNNLKSFITRPLHLTTTKEKSQDGNKQNKVYKKDTSSKDTFKTKHKSEGGKNYKGKGKKIGHKSNSIDGLKAQKGHHTYTEGHRNKGNKAKGKKNIWHKEDSGRQKKFFDHYEHIRHHDKYDDFDAHKKSDDNAYYKGDSEKGSKHKDTHGKKFYKERGRFHDDAGGEKKSFGKKGHFGDDTHYGKTEEHKASHSDKDEHGYGGGHNDHAAYSAHSPVIAKMNNSDEDPIDVHRELEEYLKDVEEFDSERNQSDENSEFDMENSIIKRIADKNNKVNNDRNETAEQLYYLSHSLLTPDKSALDTINWRKMPPVNLFMRQNITFSNFDKEDNKSVYNRQLKDLFNELKNKPKRPWITLQEDKHSKMSDSLTEPTDKVTAVKSQKDSEEDKNVTDDYEVEEDYDYDEEFLDKEENESMDQVMSGASNKVAFPELLKEKSQQVSVITDAQLEPSETEKGKHDNKSKSKSHKSRYHKASGEKGGKGSKKAAGFQKEEKGKHSKNRESGFAGKEGKKYESDDQKKKYDGSQKIGKKGRKGHSYGDKGRHHKGHSDKGFKNFQHAYAYKVNKQFYKDNLQKEGHKKFDDFDKFFDKNMKKNLKNHETQGKAFGDSFGIKGSQSKQNDHKRDKGHYQRHFDGEHHNEDLYGLHSQKDYDYGPNNQSDYDQEDHNNMEYDYDYYHQY